MKTIFLSFIFLIVVYFSFAQRPPPEYDELVKKAFALYEGKQFKESALAYSAAFKTFGWKGFATDRYNAACSWALAGNVDSAFSNLDRIVSKGYYTNYNHISTDTDLKSLYKDKRWKPLLETVSEFKEKEESGLNKPLVRLLDSLQRNDQKWRNYVTKQMNKEPGYDSLSQGEVWTYIGLTDSLNYFVLDSIFKLHGFPNYDLVGAKGSGNFWLLVQHQDNRPSFQDSVLTAMKPEVDKGKASGLNYAYLVDRVKVNSQQSQVYGTQMRLNADSTSHEPITVIDPEKLNERRKSVGLGTIEEYIEMMNQRFVGSLRKK